MCEAHSIKEWFLKVLDTGDLTAMKQEFKDWLNSVDTTDLKAFKRCVNTYFNRKKGILTLWKLRLLTALQKAATTKLRFLNETLTATVVSTDLETVFYIFSPTKTPRR